ncbi:MAG TPA: NrsF family protein, partial [Sphingomicrobium sp.]|nr:NrsF family protein [Sphingomicrobium sp.]
KVGSLGLLAIVGSVTAVASFDPMLSPRRRMTLVAGMLGLVLLTGWLVDAMRGPGASLMHRLDWRHGLDCVSWILALSIPPLVAFAVLARRGAPPRLHASALLVGVASAAWGGFVFAFRCPFDDPLYVAVWFAIAGVAVTIVARLILPRIARW